MVRAASTATPVGVLKRATLPTPLRRPAVPEPAKCETAPVETTTTRTMWLYVSATYARPLLSTAMPCGKLNLAATPVPSA